MEITREENQASAQNNTKKQKLGNSLYRTVDIYYYRDSLYSILYYSYRY